MNERDVNRGLRRGLPLRRWRRWAAWTVGVGLLAAQGVAWAQAAIRAVSASVVGGSEVVRIETSAPLPGVPAGFATQTPPRIALDFPATTNASGKSLIEVNQGNLRSVNVVEAGERTRVVLNLIRNVPYEARAEGNVLLVTLQPPVTTAQAEAAQAPTFPGVVAPAGAGVALADIDFRRGEEGAGRVVVQLGSAQTPVDIRPQGRNIVVEFQRTTLPEGLRRRLDVTDFGTPVRMVTATQAGDRVRLLVENAGEWEHSAYQSDNQFVLEVRPVKPDPNKLVAGPRYSGDRLSLNFQNIDVRALLQVIADFTGFNIITTDTVQGSLTLRLKDVPWDQALDIILEAKQLGMTRTGNVIRVAPRKELADETKFNLEQQALAQKLIPLKSESFQLNYAKASDVAAQLLGTDAVDREGRARAAPTTDSGVQATGDSRTLFSSGTRILSDRGVAVAEPRTNRLFVMDVPERLEKIAELIKLLDIPVRQVLIEARIVEADEGVGKALGVRFGGMINGATLGTVNGSRVLMSVGGGGSYGATSPGLSGAMVNLPAQPLSQAASTAAGAIGATIFNSTLTRMLSLEIQALEADRRVRVISSPRLITSDLKKAVIEQGEEIPYQTNSANQGTNVQFKKAVLKLDVMPQITPDGSVILDVEVSKDSRGDILPGGVAINTNKVQTKVLVENGGTVAIGGIFRSEETTDNQKIPGLGDLPAVGGLFRSKRTSLDRKELIVFLTPRILPAVMGGQ
ncbi:Type IV pilus biogenesis and competence protein PilQ [Tepidimonas sediminis]|uniref:Type IV pilus biogenesis and competence protein PilQ n=1 Tax=Tepidimonas sediminis TaxID=2588941 RepID=A0A554WPZ4_9BURK|nr:type IV pilus secretin family protein [Tepidimonas sediminis]TSE25648.1 Type IV pilus biogenesis and competence protein PilQ [Tepidimonas sediminis]